MLNRLYSHIAKFIPVYLWVMVGCIAFGKSYAVSINLTDSLPGTLFLIEKQRGANPNVGELAAFLYDGKAYYRKGTIFVKIVRGRAGSIVKVKEIDQGVYDYYVDGVFTGRNKLFSNAGMPIKRARTGLIPEDHFYMYGSNPDSLDSRYEVVGWVPRDHIIGIAHRIF